MTKDYRRGSPPPRRRDQRRGTCAFWFLFGGVIGAFGVGYAWMTQEPPAPGITAEQTTTRPPPAPTPEPEFDFYSLLPEEEVTVPAETPAEPTPLPSNTAAASAPRTPATASTAKPKSTSAATAGSGAPGSYLLQIGSFRSTGDAERLKAQLALIGVQTQIQSATVDGKTYYRVRTGALEKGQAQSVKAKLKGEGHDSIMMGSR